MAALPHQAALVQGPAPTPSTSSSQAAAAAPWAPACAQQRHRRRRAALRASSTGGSGGLSYKDAGVDIDAGNELVKRIQKLNPNIGGFSGMVPFGDSFLVAGTDGVGTKLKLAFDMNKHDTVGIDLVAMSVNDIVTSGAQPMFFLDYFACGKLDVDTAEQVIKGIVEGCRQSDCVLLGGETAEMPGFYSPGEYDLAGFAVGSVKKDAVIDGSRIQAGDAILGLASSGVHSNGFSLVRKVLEVSGTSLHDTAPWAPDTSVGLSLLTPTVLYVRDCMKMIGAADVRGLVHMTGGGFPENIPRVVPKGMAARIRRSAWEVPALFQWLQEAGKVPDSEMFRTFNMGVGMIIVVPRSEVDKVLGLGIGAFELGEIVEGSGVELV
ncbi:phosphoribosylformylglycinamidine cyclo-ligase [Chlorella sorokiniana]|uniref:Phosphoribosylformylglycinamidine cyclo-ligase n=1 Tax=Chlorella sorokiniana TaxID=3076 RepID=A0A2P6TBB3_CHLSO|nr:phosphoribosylformylglycinamidine cyclo-ligase [Chlorella sorokiniana]|eukprot:PRW05839.1 phosphoribosylformylglycinamidine cyclo-ligase [Chlorella sorokiniana]